MISSELGTFESHDSGRGSVPLGTCGATVFACAHAMWYTPEGARAALSVHSLRCKDHSLADSEDPLAEEPMVDVHLYMPYGKVCSTQCAPDRTRKPACDDAEAVSAIRYRNCTDKRLARGQCSREVLRCLNWNELKEFAIAPDVRLLLGGWTPAASSRHELNEVRKAFRRCLRQRGGKFLPPRYWGYGHFVQDRWGVEPNLHSSKNQETGIGTLGRMRESVC